MSEKSQNKNKGSIGEDLACAYLESKGYEILERNFRSRFGEIDIVAKEGGTVCIVEVKWRKNSKIGSAADAVDAKKQLKLMRMAKEYYLRRNLVGPIRIDVVAIDGDGQSINLIRNAVFEY